MRHGDKAAGFSHDSIAEVSPCLLIGKSVCHPTLQHVPVGAGTERKFLLSTRQVISSGAL